jgi:LmbE family N-acetylglucosaminyl deacetylase
MKAERKPGSLPSWPSVLAVFAHPDDESFGLGAVLAAMAAAGAAVHALCFTRGEASTLNATGADLHTAREGELRRAATELGLASTTLLDYPDGGLAGVPASTLAGHIRNLVAAHEPAGVLVFDDTGITGHPDHQAATRAAGTCPLPVLAWTLPDEVAGQLKAETGRPFAGRQPDQIDLVVRVDRTAQRRAAREHASQVTPVLWRRLELLGDREYLRWLRRP